MKAAILYLSFMGTQSLPNSDFDGFLDRLLIPSNNLFPRRLHGQFEVGTETGPDSDMSDVKNMNLLNFPLLPSLTDIMHMGSMFGSAFADLAGDFKFEMPNVTLSDTECLITVNLNDLDLNRTSFQVYGTPSALFLEITSTKESNAKIYQQDEAMNITHPLHLRGAASFSSLTSIRSFPAPQGCDTTSHTSKATIDKKTNELLIKIPSIATPAKENIVDSVTEPLKAHVVHRSSLLSEIPRVDDSAALVRSALSLDDTREGHASSWLQRLFNTADMRPSMKIQVPLVKREEF